MFRALPPLVRGAIAATLLALNTLFWCSAAVRVRAGEAGRPGEAACAPRSTACSTRSRPAGSPATAAGCGATQRTHWDVDGFDGLAYRGWYLVNCNHQSWVDILVLQHLLNRRIPMLKFFLKQQLIYVPVIGLAWWALDFPFMRRHSDAYLRSHPEKRFDDIETTRRACEKFALVPTSRDELRRGHALHAARSTARSTRPYRHLLKPKAGALALALDVLGDRFDALLDVTIVYPDGAPDVLAVPVRQRAADRRARAADPDPAGTRCAATTRTTRRTASRSSTGCRRCGATRTGRSTRCWQPTATRQPRAQVEFASFGSAAAARRAAARAPCAPHPPCRHPLPACGERVPDRAGEGRYNARPFLRRQQ